ncbi:MAG: serine hydrolase [Planctomycetes bacterium]|nr:serine hydrolase [Planctomycetota bacterium]
MERVYKVLSICLIVLGFLCTTKAQSTSIAENPEVASGIRLLEAWIESQMAYKGWPGLSIGIVYDQKLIWSKGFGYADVEKKTPATPDTIYRIASNSKMFTSIAIMKLRDEGKLQLDDPVAKHLSWFKIKNKHPDAPVITIRHLLTHTSGLPREAAFPYWTDFKFPTREQIIEKLPEQETIYPSENKWKYSNLAFTLAGEIVSAVSNESYTEYIHKQIIEPLGMSSTSVIIPDEHKSRLATGYGRRMPDGSRQIMPFTDCKGLTPAGNMSSTVKDLARFAFWQFRLRESVGTEIVKASTLKEMQRVHWLFPDWKTGWGLGFMIVHKEARDIVEHGGHVGGYQTEIAISPKEKVAVIVLVNADDANPYADVPFSIVDRAFEWMAPAITKAVTPPKADKADPKWNKYVGKYRNIWRDYTVLVMNGELVLIDPTQQDPKAPMLTLTPVEKHTFRIDGEGFGELGELVVFELGTNGEVVRMKLGENYVYPQDKTAVSK